MYQNLHFAVKQRILSEIEDAFKEHPAFSGKVKIYNKFPYEERVQFGAVLRNTSASQIRLSADNFMSDLFSHVRLAKNADFPGLGVEWVRENEGFVTQLIEEDVSSQVTPNLRFFSTFYPILSGPDETHYTTSPGQVTVKINGVEVIPESVDGETGLVILEECPSAGAEVIIEYYKRNIMPPGIYTIEFTEDTEFVIHPIYIIENELLIELTTGTETESTLAHPPLDSGSEDIVLCYKNGVRIDSLVRDVDYSIDYNSGVITYLNPLLKNYSIYADYHFSRADFGPYTFNEYQENHTALPGIIISIGRRAKKGDQQIVLVSQFREQQAKIYGGHWEMNMDVSVIAKDPLQMAQMSDQIVNYLWGERKNVMEFEGITLNRVEPTGETEEVHIETTGDVYHESSVSINLQTEWQNFVPYIFYLRLKNILIIPDSRSVLKGPVAGYEKLT